MPMNLQAAIVDGISGSAQDSRDRCLCLFTACAIAFAKLPSFFLLHAVVAVLLWLRQSVRNSFSPTLPAT